MRESNRRSSGKRKGKGPLLKNKGRLVKEKARESTEREVEKRLVGERRRKRLESGKGRRG